MYLWLAIGTCAFNFLCWYWICMRSYLRRRMRGMEAHLDAVYETNVP